MNKIDEVKMEDILRQPEAKPAVAGKSEKPEPATKPALSPKKPKKPKNIWKIIAIVILALLVVGLAGWGVYSYTELEKLRSPEYTEQQAQQESKALVDKVSKLIELPDEEPVVATVSDKEKLADQPFFAKAENGDKVLIFSESSMAIIYRESTDKIINSGPIAISSTEE